MKTLILKFKKPNYLFWMGVFMLILCGSTYAFSLNGAIGNVVVRSESAKKISALHAEVSKLESSYVSLKNKITLDLAFSLGFKSTARISFLGGGKIAGNELSLRTE